MVAALELLSVRRRHERDGHAVPAPVLVRPRPRQDEQVLGLLGGLAAPRVELREGVVGHALAPLALRVRHDRDVLLKVLRVRVREAFRPFWNDECAFDFESLYGIDRRWKN